MPPARPEGPLQARRRRQIRNFTGIDAPYEAPAAPEMRLRTADAAAETLAERVIEDLRRRAIIV